MVKKRRRHLRKSIKYSLILIVLVLGLLGVYKLFFSSSKWDAYTSANEDALSINNEYCLLYYPKGFKDGSALLNELCDKEKEEDQIFDYNLESRGEYIRLSYDENHAYYLNKDYNTPEFKELSERGVMILSDYLRYTMKKSGLDYAYTLDFLEDSYYENIGTDRYECEVEGTDLSCYFKEYDCLVKVPLDDIGKEAGIDVLSNKDYVKPTYYDADRPIIALSFDDGPNLNSGTSKKIIDALYYYDANATFFTIGYRLNDNAIELLKDSISKGNSYGSHTMNHYDLRSLSKDEMLEEVMGVSDFFKENLNYTMKLYRPSYGYYNDTVDNTIPLAAAFWTVDSEDWSYRDPQKIYDEVMNDVHDHAIVLFHDLYTETAQSLDEYHLIRDLIAKGYQIVTVEALADVQGIELGGGVHLGWN